MLSPALTRIYKDRLNELRHYVEEEIALDNEQDDTSPPNEYAIDQFWRFMHRYAPGRRAGIVMQDSGDPRVVWSKDDASRIGIQFKQNGSVIYVILIGRQGPRTAGETDHEGVIRVFREYNLLSFLEIADD